MNQESAKEENSIEKFQMKLVLSKTNWRSGFENPFRFFIDRMVRIWERGISGQWKGMERSKS